jgi:hypothetical protein
LRSFLRWQNDAVKGQKHVVSALSDLILSHLGSFHAKIYKTKEQALNGRRRITRVKAWLKDYKKGATPPPLPADVSVLDIGQEVIKDVMRDEAIAFVRSMWLPAFCALVCVTVAVVILLGVCGLGVAWVLSNNIFGMKICAQVDRNGDGVFQGNENVCLVV